MSMHNLGIPDLPERAFVRHGRNILPQGGKGSAPKTPDYEAAAKATAAGNLEAAKYAVNANRANQYTPWGSLEWTNNRTFDQAGYDAAMRAYQQGGATNPSNFNYTDQEKMMMDRFGRGQPIYRDGVWGWAGTTGGDADMGTFTPMRNQPGIGPGGPGAGMPNREDFYTGGDNWSQTITLSPEMQALFDQEMALQQGLFGAQDLALGRVNRNLGVDFDMSGIPDAGAVYDPTLATNNATELLMQRINPELDRQNEALRAQLANQGITQGSTAYANAMNQFGQQRNDAATQAALQGINLGMQQQGMQYNQQTNNRQQALALASYLRNLPLNELNALRTGNQVSMPQFPAYAQQAATGGPDMLGAAQNTYNAQLGAYNAQQAAGGSMMSGLLGLGSLGLGAYGAGLFGGLGGGAPAGVIPGLNWLH